MWAVEEEDLENSIKLLIDPTYEVRQRPQEGERLEETGGNIYEKGITHEELNEARQDPEFKLDLNTRVIRGEDGKLKIEKQTVKTLGIVGWVLRRVVKELKNAMRFSSTLEQKVQLQQLIWYYTTGDVERFRKSSIAWVKDRDQSIFDFTTSFQEVYEDHLGLTGSMENVIVFSDPVANQLAKNIASNAQYFENLMPYGPFKKIFSQGYAPPAIIAPYFLELSSMKTGGFNLPNFDDIRMSVGFKNIIRVPLDSTSKVAQEVALEAFSEFLLPEKAIEVVANLEKIWLAHVLLHEIIGHGSGTYDESKYVKGEDPISAIAQEIGSSIASALEEERADLTGLVFVNDPQLVAAGLYKDQAEADKIRDLSYDWYFADFLKRFARGRSWAGAHARGHLLFAMFQLAHGGVEWISKNPSEALSDDNRVLKVVDYHRVQQLSCELLEKLQLYKATKNLNGIKSLFETYAPIQLAQSLWAKALIKRSEGMKMHWASFEQGWDIQKTKNTYSLSLDGNETLEDLALHFAKKGYY
jgi:dipeptidyl-peptidase-3